MIEIQCTSCHTRYRIDERVLPEDTPTFKCSRCGHVFSAEPRGARRPAAPKESSEAQEQGSQPAPRQPSRRAAALKSAATLNARPATPAVEPVAPPAPPPAQTAPPHASAAPSEPQNRAPAPPASEPRAEEAAAPEAPLSEPPAAELARSFAAPSSEEPPAGENLTFDFDDTPTLEDDPEAAVDRHHGDWRVGDDPAEVASHRGPISSPPLAAPHPSASADEVEAPEDEVFFSERATIPDHPPYVPDHSRVHSTGFVLGLFVMVVLLFGAGSLLICNAPVASAEFLNTLPGIAGRFASPIVPARLVALKDVNANYRTIKGNRALVITGNAINVGTAPLHTVQLAASLIDSSQRPVAGGTVFCGNNVSPTMIGEMTPQELEFFQRLGPPRHFIMKPLVPTRFTMVFINPPAAVSSFSIAVAKAQPASSDELARQTPAN
ncbi:MAG TPA: zinc-ribbon domain-containing protein [Candidatus Binataceae bacterium]|nr:zinc-ribbon domain-containing protein [Candidatus Binataceae bacterium]